ncbi:VCBS domain-containing protein, partial [Limibacillus halophilus]
MTTSAGRTAFGKAVSFTISDKGEGVFLLPVDSVMRIQQIAQVGDDLVLTGADGSSITAQGYFATATPPALAMPNGELITPDDIASRLENLQFAQSDLVASDGQLAQALQPIGQVETLTGDAQATRGGVLLSLDVGSPVFEGDVVQTGSDTKIGISFIDGTVFSLTSNTQIVLDELVYDPGGSDNSLLFNVVQGTFVFITGQVAPTGDMKVDTPVATIGIRGTTGSGACEVRGDVCDFKIHPDPPAKGGGVGEFVLTDRNSPDLQVVVNDPNTVIRVTGSLRQVEQFSKTNLDLQDDKSLLDLSYESYRSFSGRNEEFQNDNVPGNDQRGDVDGLTPAQLAAILGIEPAAGPPEAQPQPEGDPQSGGRSEFLVGPISPLLGLDPLGLLGVEAGLKVGANFTFNDRNLISKPVEPGFLIATPTDVLLQEDDGQSGATLPGNQETVGSVIAVDPINQNNLTITLDPNESNAVWSDGVLSPEQIETFIGGFDLVDNGNGEASWTYTIPNSELQFLDDLESVSLTFVVQVGGASSALPETMATITIVIEGVDDDPIILGGGEFTVTEDVLPEGQENFLVPDPGFLFHEGQLTYSDPDANDVVTLDFSQTTPPAWSAGTLPPDVAAALSSGFSLIDNGDGTADWFFTIDNGLVQFLDAGESLSVTFTVSASDGDDPDATQDITIIVQGTEDGIVVGDDTGAVTEDLAVDSGNLITSGTVSLSDEDANDQAA